MISCKEMASALQWAAVRAKNEIEIPTDSLMKALAEESKGYLGHYQTGWAPLKPETIARKAKGDTPLLETGTMRDSIEHEAELTATGAEGVIGSLDKVAVYQELGTSRGIPPRPFLSLSMMRAQPQATVIFGKFALSLLTR